MPNPLGTTWRKQKWCHFGGESSDLKGWQYSPTTSILLTGLVLTVFNFANDQGLQSKNCGHDDIGMRFHHHRYKAPNRANANEQHLRSTETQSPHPSSRALENLDSMAPAPNYCQWHPGSTAHTGNLPVLEVRIPIATLSGEQTTTATNLCIQH